MFNAITCPVGLVFNPKTGICTWPDQAQKVGCSSEGKVGKPTKLKLQLKNIFQQMFSTFLALKSTNLLQQLTQDMLILMIGN
jgi:Chitin binding Peritrophin-A domain